MTETISVSSSTDAEATRRQTTETHSREPVSFIASTVTSALHPFSSLSTADSTAETVTSEDVTSHAATTTAALMEEKGLSAKPSKSTIINVSETLLFSAQTGHLGDKLSESAVTMIPEKTTVKDVLSPSSFSSGLPSTESEASGDDTSNMFSKEFTTTSSSLYTPDHELTKTSSDMTETISLSSSTYAEASRDQTTETHSRGTVSSLDSTVTSAVHPFSSLSTGDSTGEKVTSKDVTSHSATTTSTMMEDKDLSPKPSESTIINVSDTLFSSAHTRHLDKTLSEITVAMVSENTTAKDVLSPSSFSSSLTSMESEASGDDTSNMFSKEFTATRSSLYTSNKSDHELTKTSSDTTETISVSSSTDAEATRGLSPDLLSREPVSSLESTVTSAVHTFSSLSTGDSKGETDTSEYVTSPVATTTATIMEGKDLSAKPSGSTIINVLETLFSSAHTGHLDKTLSEITVAMVSEKTTAKDVLSPSSFSSSLTSMESEASGDDTSNMFSKEFTATSSSLYTSNKSDHELTKTLSDMTEKFSVSSSTDAEASRDQTNETHSRATVSSLDSTVTSAVHPFPSPGTADSTAETVTSEDVTSHAATTTAALMEEKGLSAKPSKSSIINVSETLLFSAQTGHLGDKLSKSAVTMIPEKTTVKDVLSPSSFSSGFPSTESEASGDDTSNMFSKEFTTTSSSLYTPDHELTKTSSDMTETISLSSSTYAEASRDQTTETHSRGNVSSLDSTVTSAVHTFSSLSTGDSTGETVTSKDVTSHAATTTATPIEEKGLSAKPSESTIINVSETLLSSAQTGHLDEKLSESAVTVIPEKTTAKDVLSSSFSSSLESTDSEASGDETSDMFSKEFTATSSSPYIPTKSDHELTKTLSDMTEKFSVSSSTDAEASRDQTNETHSRATVSSLDSTVTSAVHPFPSPGTADSTAETVTSEDVTSHAATTTAALMEEKGLSAKPSKSSIINVSETLLFSAQTGHLGDKLSKSAVTMIPEKTTVKDVLSPSSFSSGFPSTESEASGDDTSNMFSKEFTTTSSSLYTPDHELTKTSSDMTETISLSSSTYAEASRDQTTETHSRGNVSSLDSTVTSAVHTFSSLSTGDSTGETVTSKDVTSHAATTTATPIEEKGLSAKPSESTIINVSETLLSSAQTGHLDEKLSESAVTVIPEKTTAKDVLSSSFSSSLESTDSEASGDETSDMFSKEFTATSSSPYIPTKSDHELTKTLSDMTEKFSVSSSTDAEASRDQTNETHSRATVSSLDSTVTSAVHPFPSPGTADSTAETVTSEDVTSHAATTTAALMEEKGLSAKPSKSSIINVSETLLFSAQTGHLGDKLSKSAVTMIPEKTTVKDVLSPSSFSSGFPSTESEASGDDTSNMFSKEFTTTSSSLYTPDHELTKTSSDMTETISLSSSTYAEASRDQTTETHSRGNVSSLDSTVTSAVHTFSSLSTGDSTGETVTSKDVTSHAATTTATPIEEKGLSAKPSESTISNVSETLLSSAQTGHLDEKLSESAVTVIPEKTTAKDVLSSSFSSSLESTDSEASGDETSDMFSKEFTATSSSLYIPTKSDHELTKTLSDMTEKFSVSSSTDSEASRDQTNETHSRATVSSLDSTVTSAVHPFPSPGTADSTAETVTSEDVTSHAATTTAALMEEKGLSAKPSKSSIINVSETLLFSAQTGHLGDKLSKSAVTMIPEKTTVKDVLSPSSFSSGFPSTESEASGDDTSNMFSKEFTTTSSSLYTPDHELTKTII